MSNTLRRFPVKMVRCGWSPTACSVVFLFVSQILLAPPLRAAPDLQRLQQGDVTATEAIKKLNELTDALLETVDAPEPNVKIQPAAALLAVDSEEIENLNKHTDALLIENDASMTSTNEAKVVKRSSQSSLISTFAIILCTSAIVVCLGWLNSKQKGREVKAAHSIQSATTVTTNSGSQGYNSMMNLVEGEVGIKNSELTNEQRLQILLYGELIHVLKR